MELFEGKSLQSLLDSGQAFPLPGVLTTMEQTAARFTFAHERNNIGSTRGHQAANLMLTADYNCKKSDGLRHGQDLPIRHVCNKRAHVHGHAELSCRRQQCEVARCDGRSEHLFAWRFAYE